MVIMVCSLTDHLSQSRDITFASVHDSYWTHAASVDEMSVVIRDTFIQLHSSDILTKLDDEVSFTLITSAVRLAY